MNDEDYAAIVSAYNNREIEVGIDRSSARKFYTSIPLDIIGKETGETPYTEAAIVRFCFYSPPLFVLASCVVSAFAFGWRALAIIPITITVYFVASSMSWMPNAGCKIFFVVFLCAITSLFVIDDERFSLAWPPSSVLGRRTASLFGM